MGFGCWLTSRSVPWEDTWTKTGVSTIYIEQTQFVGVCRWWETIRITHCDNVLNRIEGWPLGSLAPLTMGMSGNVTPNQWFYIGCGGSSPLIWRWLCIVLQPPSRFPCTHQSFIRKPPARNSKTCRAIFSGSSMTSLCPQVQMPRAGYGAVSIPSKLGRPPGIWKSSGPNI